MAKQQGSGQDRKRSRRERGRQQPKRQPESEQERGRMDEQDIATERDENY